METIKNYLEAMFANMPNNEAVIRAKSELLQMMEDKYNELISEGLAENAAVGTVISEFGNLDELAEDLGIKDEVITNNRELEDCPRKTVTLSDARDYLATRKAKGIKKGAGVFLCIICVIFPIIGEAINSEILGVLGMFLSLAVAVAIFMITRLTKQPTDYIDNIPCQLDFSTAQYVSDEQGKYNPTHAVILTLGVILCSLCWLPAAILDMAHLPGVLDELYGVILFLMVGSGVFLIIYTSTINKAFEKLLALNDKSRISGNYVPDKQIEYTSSYAQLVMELFWPVITCIYLMWSFITFDWWKTWIIWIIASIVHAFLKKSFIRK